MNTAAKPLGVELIAREQALDVAFRDHTAAPAAVTAAAAEIGALQGRLRAVHLSAHLVPFT
jgi:hypothetical protein